MVVKKRRVLILGGTTEATTLIKSFIPQDQVEVILSLAGVTKNPVLPVGVTTRIGGFGGIEKMAQWIRDNQIEAVIDATHPFAQQVTNNAYQATQQIQCRFLRLERPAWARVEGDVWYEVETVSEAVMALGAQPARVFVTIGRKELLPFKEGKVEHHYWIRSVDRPDAAYLPKDATLIEAKGPFTEEEEYNFLKNHQIQWIVSKNSGGETVYAKISAARKLGIPVMMIQRPQMPVMPCVDTWQQAREWVLNPVS